MARKNQYVELKSESNTALTANSFSELSEATKKINKATLNIDAFDIIPVYIMILNTKRQIIYANKLFRETFGNCSELTGKKVGEAINCIHSESGCRTSKYCKMCGLMNTIIESEVAGFKLGESVLSLKNNHAMNIRVWSQKKKIMEEDFTFVILSDISFEIRRVNLEKIFFHKLLNIAGGLQGMLHLLNETGEDQYKEQTEYLNFITSLTDRLIDEIKSYRTTDSAEEGNLTIKPAEFLTAEILEEVKQHLSRLEVLKGKKIVISPKSAESFIYTDRNLLKRVLINLLKNALEASNKGDSVTMHCNIDRDQIEFIVENKTVIPENIQLRMFQRSFSTKEKGRGYGMYTVKLIAENYLKGSVSFTSDPEKGTKFSVRLPFRLEI